MVRTVCKPLGHRSTCHRGTRSVSRSTGLQNAHYTKPSCYALDNIFEPIVLDECHVFQVSPLSKESITQASVVITRAFAVSPQYIPIDECRNYCSRLLKHDESEGIMLVGSMSPGPDCPECEQSYLLEGQDSRAVATVSLSFCDKTRENFRSLKPPDDEPYLCNMAVDPAFRRRGLATHMLKCAEEYCKSKGYRRMCLHVRLGDEAARDLYLSCGYEEIQSDRYAAFVFVFLPSTKH
jgi:GNAT superfamily N-acetyltransferase